MAATLHVLRVFTGEQGEHGNPLGVFLDGAAVPEAERQAVAADLGFAETVFVDDPGQGRVRIFTPVTELPFAGHPSVGTAWLLAQHGHPVETLRPPAGELPVRREDDLTFVAARPEWAPEFEYRRLGSAAEVDALTEQPEGGPGIYFWAWSDEAAGDVRARALFEGLGITEDEATGSAAIVLCSQLGRPVTIHQGKGSVIHVAPLDGGMAEVGGRVVLDEVREYELGG